MFFSAGLLASLVIVFALIIFIRLKITLNAGLIFGVFIFFDIFSFILSKTFPGISPIFILFGLSIFSIIVIAVNDYQVIVEAIKTPPIAYFICFGLFLIASVFWSKNPNYGSYKAQLFWVKGLLPGVAIFLVTKGARKFSWKPAILIGLIYVLVSIAYGQTTTYLGRQTLEGTNPIWIARSSLLFASLVLLTISRPLWQKLLYSSPGIVTAFLAQSKGPFLGIISAGILHFFNKKAKSSNEQTMKVYLRYSLFFLIIITILLVFVIYSGLLAETRFAMLFDYKKMFSELSFLDRIVRYIKAVNLFIENPFLGVGSGGFSVLDERDYPHNIVLEISAELGIMGLLLWLAGLVTLYVRLRSNPVLLFLFVQTILYTLFSGDLAVNTEYVLISFLSLALTKPVKENPMKGNFSVDNT